MWPFILPGVSEARSEGEVSKDKVNICQLENKLVVMISCIFGFINQKKENHSSCLA
jgi:hypothetical protein